EKEMKQILGEFIEELEDKYQSLELTFNNPEQLTAKQWRNHRLAAYFQADYFVNLLPINEDDINAENRIEEGKNALNYIGNELLENAMKFNQINDNYYHPVKMAIYLIKNLEEITAVMLTENSINNESYNQFKTVIEKLLSSNIYDLYIQQIEKVEQDENSEESGLGLLTIINDYEAKLGWKFQSNSSNSQLITVTTMAQIVV
ncbi:MAG TPA: hypothetical protein V6C58_20585, partial [Allocoleopsis sp.]